MAAETVDVQRLIVSLEAQTVKYERALQRASQTALTVTGQIDSHMKRPQGSIDRLSSSLDRVVKPRAVRLSFPEAEVTRFQRTINAIKPPESFNLESIKAALGGLAAAYGLSEIRKFSDEWRSAGNRIVAAGVDAEKMPIVLDELSRMAERSRVSLEQTAKAFSGMTRAAREFGGTRAQALVATETVTKALTLSGSTRQELKGSLVDLVQGLQRGYLQGKELRAILGEVPAVATAIAKEFGVSVGALKELGKEGKLTSERVFKGLLNAAPEVNKAFAQTTSTVAQAFGNLETAATRFVGQSKNLGAATQGVITVTEAVSHNFSAVAEGATALGAVIATRLISRGLSPSIVEFGKFAKTALSTAAAHVEFANVVGTSIVPMGAATVAAKGLSAALDLVGGPFGALLLGTSLAVTYFASQAQEAAVRSRGYAAALQRVRDAADAAGPAIRTAGEAVAEANRKMDEAQKNAINKGMTNAIEDQKRAVFDLVNVLVRYPEALRAIGKGDFLTGLANVRSAFGGSADAALQARNEIMALANANPEFQNLADTMDPLIMKIAGVSARLGELKAQLGAIGRAAAPQDLKAFGSLDVEGIKGRMQTRYLQDRTDNADRTKGSRIRKRAAEIEGSKQGGALLNYGQAYDQATKEIGIQDAHKGRHHSKAKSQTDKMNELAQEVRIAGLSKVDQSTVSKAQSIGFSDKEVNSLIGGMQSGNTSGLSKKSQTLIDDETQLDMMKKARALYDASKTAAQKYAESVNALNAMLAQGKMSQEAFNQAMKHLNEAQNFKWVDTVSASVGKALEGMVEHTKSAKNAWLDFRKTMADLAWSTLVEGSIKQLFRSLLGPLTGAGGGATGTGGGGLIGTLLGSLLHVGGGGSAGASSGGLLGGFGGFLASLFGGGGAASGASQVGSAAAAGGLLYHMGGTVGPSIYSRTVPAGTFAGAPRYHGGLSPGEFPAILQHGEHVLTASGANRTAGTIAGLSAAAAAGPKVLNVHAGDVVVQGSIDSATLPQVRAEMAQRVAALQDTMQRHIGAMSSNWSKLYG